MLGEEIGHHGAGIAQPVAGGRIGGVIEGRVGRGPRGQREAGERDAAQQDHAGELIGAVPHEAAEGGRMALSSVS